MDLFTIIIRHADLVSVGIVIAATGLLGFIAAFNDYKNATNRAFLFFCLLTIAWGSLNYLSHQIINTELALWTYRLSIFAATWHVYFLFRLLSVFPKASEITANKYHKILLWIVSLTSLLNLTPLTFNHVEKISASGQITEISNGPGIILFSLVIFSVVIGSIVVLIKKLHTEKDLSPQQVRPVFIGIVLTFVLILAFNFISPAFFNNSQYVSLGALFIFPFILGTSYSIFKHGFLNIKVVSTEVLTFVLSLVILIETATSQDLPTLIFRSLIFLLVIFLGVLLIKSVIKEIKQRELLENLTKQLEGANEKLKSLDQARAEFITIASHQLRTPPATIKWYLSSILDGDYGKLKPDQKEILEKTNRTNNSLISLVDDMLNVSRIERGKMEFLFEQVSLLDLAKTTFEQLEPIAKDKKLTLTFKYSPKTKFPKLMADKEKIRQVMNNLIDNALKYTKQGTVAVNIMASKDEIKFSVTDSGKGIAPEEQISIFEKYTRGKESIKQSAGLGLGLYVAKIIVGQHKGKIWAESSGEGKGSTFAFTVPINNELKETTLVDLAKNQG